MPPSEAVLKSVVGAATGEHVEVRVLWKSMVCAAVVVSRDASSAVAWMTGDL